MDETAETAQIQTVMMEEATKVVPRAVPRTGETEPIEELPETVLPITKERMERKRLARDEGGEIKHPFEFQMPLQARLEENSEKEVGGRIMTMTKKSIIVPNQKILRRTNAMLRWIVARDVTKEGVRVEVRAEEIIEQTIEQTLQEMVTRVVARAEIREIRAGIRAEARVEARVEARAIALLRVQVQPQVKAHSQAHSQAQAVPQAVTVI